MNELTKFGELTYARTFIPPSSLYSHYVLPQGPAAVVERAKANTDPEVLAMYGGGDIYPLSFGDFAENGNYLEPDEIAVRHGICGDPEQVGGWLLLLLLLVLLL